MNQTDGRPYTSAEFGSAFLSFALGFHQGLLGQSSPGLRSLQNPVKSPKAAANSLSVQSICIQQVVETPQIAILVKIAISK